MFRILRNPKVGHVAEITINGRVTKLDLETMSPADKTKAAHSLFEWRRKGYIGYPSIMMN